jgi:acyl-CoA synthetase (NDP forming)
MKLKISQDALLRFGYRAIQLIQERTAKGDGLDGKFASYSTNPLAVPSGMASKRARKALQGAGKLSYFKRKGKLWMVVQGGYAELKRAVFTNAKGNTGVPNLMVTGQMMGSLQAKVAGENSVVLTFDNPEAARKAFYHHVSGAGKRRVLRRFLGLREEELKDQRLIQTITDGANLEI